MKHVDFLPLKFQVLQEVIQSEGAGCVLSIFSDTYFQPPNYLFDASLPVFSIRVWLVTLPVGRQIIVLVLCGGLTLE